MSATATSIHHPLQVGLVASLLVAPLAAIGCGPTGAPGDGGPDAEIRNGCLALREPQAAPGDDIGGDTYETFARPFFEAHCVRCHSVTNLTTAERNSAPEGYDWDDEVSVRAHLADIRHQAGVVNFMPPSDPFPTCEQRLRLVRWIDAGAP